MKCIAVAEARYLRDHRIWVKFNNGESGEADLKDMVFKYPAASPLRDPGVFAGFQLDGWPTLTWACGFDVDPECLYAIATGKTAHIKELV
ncbi:MAG: DUF2442 domain-containing protein [Planctomycetota bacterium]